MLSCVNCVAAQATGGTYAHALMILGIVSPSKPEKARENPTYPVPDEIAGLEVHYGFEITRSPGITVARMQANVTALESEWRNTITALQFPHPTQSAREAILSNA